MLGGTPQITVHAVAAVRVLLDDAPGGNAFLSIHAPKARRPCAGRGHHFTNPVPEGG